MSLSLSSAFSTRSSSSRDGKKLTAQAIVRGLKACYGLSSPLAYFLAYVGFLFIGKFGRSLDLYEIGIHRRFGVEHDASLVHHDTRMGHKYAPIDIDSKLVETLIRDVQPSRKEMDARSDPEEKFLLNYEDVARARVRREAECRPIDAVHAEIARGEMAIILGVWETKSDTKTGIPVDHFRRWISEERLPDGWTPDHVQGLRDVKARSTKIRNAVKLLRQQALDDAKSRASSHSQSSGSMDEKA